MRGVSPLLLILTAKEKKSLSVCMVVGLHEETQFILYTLCTAGGESGDVGEGTCWIGGRVPVFGSTPTAATTSVLRAELDSCQELLQMEPDNKCNYIHPTLSVGGVVTSLHSLTQGVF